MKIVNTARFFLDGVWTMWMRTKRDWDKDEDPPSNEKKVSQDSREGRCLRRQTRETGITVGSMTLKHSESLAPVRLLDSKSPGLDLLLTIYGKKGFLLYCP